MKKISSLIAILSAALAMQAQNAPVLKYREALQIALDKNYAVVIARNNEEAATYARNVGNAGMLPTVNLSGSGAWASNNIRQVTSAGNSVQQNNVATSNYNAAAQLNWVLFDGLRMFATYDRLTQLKEQSQILTRQEMERIIVNATTAYLEIIRQKRNITATQEAIRIAGERITIAENRLNGGTGNKSDLLQSRIDQNAWKSTWYDQQAALASAKASLNQILLRDPTTDFDVEDSIAPFAIGSLNDMMQETDKGNFSTQLAQRDIAISKYTYRETNALRMPRITFNGSMNYSNSRNAAGFFLINQNLGPAVGVSAAYTVFDSWRLNTQLRTLKIARQNAEVNYEQVKSENRMALTMAYNRYLAAVQKQELEQSNVQLAEENGNLALDRYRQGITGILEVNLAQQSLLDSRIRLLDADYAVQQQALELYRIMGRLVQQQ
ncbi:MAG: TolC family protein [Flavobacteriales bacterium]